MEEIGRRIPPQLAISHVIDLGAGTGRLTEFLSQRFPTARFSLVDLSPRMLSIARQRLADSRHCEFYEAEFASLPLGDSSADLVVSACALHHVDDDGKVLAADEIVRVLRRGGAAVIVDEAISDPALVESPAALDRRMREVFYPHEKQQLLDETFADVREWPSALSYLESLFAASGLVVEATAVNDIVAVVTALKP